MDITSLRVSEGTFGDTVPSIGETQLDRAAEHAIAAQEAITELQDPALKAQADALLMSLGRKLAQREVLNRRRHMH
ncbi:hypothetical protein [Methylobacterium oryzae]|uniref:hypothetical protein n=1 Tax=Methylobacterium oryzae TaxID=334852 RepID=UPI002F35E303